MNFTPMLAIGVDYSVSTDVARPDFSREVEWRSPVEAPTPFEARGAGTRVSALAPSPNAVAEIQKETRCEVARNHSANAVEDDLIEIFHELGTPLTSLLGNLELLKAAVSADLPQPLRHLLARALANAQRLTATVADLRQLAAGDPRLVARALTS